MSQLLVMIILLSLVYLGTLMSDSEGPLHTHACVCYTRIHTHTPTHTNAHARTYTSEDV